MATGVGTATLDFGGTPRRDATVTVTGVTTISVTDHVEAFFQGNDSTADHPAETHKWIFPLYLKPVAHNIVAGTSFDITILSPFPLKGQVKVRWVFAS